MQIIIGALLLLSWLVAGDLHVEPRPIGPKPLHLGHDTDWALFDSTVAAMRRTDPKAPVVIVTGDLLAHYFPHDEALARRTMARIVQTFNAAFPRAQFVIVPGNNDDPCGDYRATPGDPYYAYLAHLWAPLVNRNGAAPDFERDFATYGWYSARLPGKAVNVIALDSVYWSFVYRSCSGIHANAPQRELQWLGQSLATMRDARVIVVMHIPPGDDAMSTLETHRLFVVPFLQPQATATLLGILHRYGSTISFVITGHVHRSDFRLLGGVAMLVVPAVSPVSYSNPTFLRLDIGANGTLRDYTPFYYDFRTREWNNAVSFDRAYGVTSFSPSALAAIHQRLGTDDDLQGRWANIAVSNSGYSDVNSRTLRVYWCAQTEVGERFSNCSGVRRRIQTVIIAFIVAAAVVVAALVVTLRRRRRNRPPA